MATQFTDVTIGGTDYKHDVVHAELWRTVSSIGNWMVVLRNIDGTYNGVFDVQDDFQIDVDGNTLMEGRLDGPNAVTLRGRDFESDWDEQNNISVVKAVLCAVKSDERRPHLLEI